MNLAGSAFDVLEDLRARHQAVVDLIYFTDTQATTLLQLYVTVGLALGTGGVSALTGNAPLPLAVGWGLVASTVPLLAGCFHCLRATAARSLNLPGRGAEFWRWASTEGLSEEDVLDAYLANLEVKQVANNDLNQITAGALKRAKRAGAVAPIVLVVASVLAFAALNAASASDPGSSDCPSPWAGAAGEASVPCLP